MCISPDFLNMINELSEIHKKINTFIKKYYKNQIIRGSLILIILLLVSFLIVVSSEFLGHFSSLIRTIIFFSSIILFLLAFIPLFLRPFLAYFKIGKTIDSFQVNEILEKHFPELKDQLKNILELEDMQKVQQSSQLIEHAILQKSNNIKTIPFAKAIRLKSNYKYLRLIGVPFLILLSLYLFSPNVLLEGTERIMNFDRFYQKPSPFIFVIDNDSLSVKKGQHLKLIVHTEGDYIPYPIYIKYGAMEYLLKKDEDNLFSYEFKNVNQDFEFYLTAEDFSSQMYQVLALPVPKIIDFSIKISPPSYTQIEQQTLRNNGDFLAPEGSVVEWKFKTKDIESLNIVIGDSIHETQNIDQNNYLKEIVLKKDLQYSVSVENKIFKQAEVLKYLAQVIPDEYPGISIKSVLDSLNPTVYYFRGQASDDYGISKINFCYILESKQSLNVIEIPTTNREALQEFFYAFDFKDVVSQGEKLSYYFEVWDNDGFNSPKKTKSSAYQFYLPLQKEIDKIEDEQSKSMQEKLEKTQELAEELQKDVQDIKRDLVDKETNSWQINKKLSNIAEKQNRLEELMEEVAEENKKNNELLKNLSKEDQLMLEKQKEIEDLLSQLMDEEMKKLMEEINKLMKDFNKDKFNELTEKMEMSYEDLSEQLDRNLEQLKRFEVEKKMQQAINELEKLAEEHQKLSEETAKDEDSKEALEEKQAEHQEKMKDIAEKVKESMEKNQKLEEPMNLQDQSEEMNDIEEGMKESSESLQKGKSGKASKQQKSSSEQMQELAEQMQEMMDEAANEQQQMDMEALRQIIENLTSFSFEQEDIMLNFRNLKYKDPQYIVLHNKQTKIKNSFELIKDSLLALALTEPMISAPINKELLKIEKELAKAESALDDRRARKAQTAQQFVMTSANNLALLLSEIQEQMKNQQAQSKDKKSGECKNPGGGKPKPGFGKAKSQAKSLKSQMQSMLDQLKKGGQGKGGKQGNKPTKGELGKMIAEQEKLQKMLNDLSNGQGIAPGTAKKLKEISNISKQVEDDLIQQNITPTTLKRQELILTRLLEAENSEFKREQDNKREANQVKNPKISDPKAIFNKQEKDLISKDILIRSKVKLKQFYKERYKNYILNLNE